MYKCIKGFSLEKCDDNGFTIAGEYETIEEGSVWNIPEDKDYRIIGGEIRLENDEDAWIEISKETLEEYFSKLEEAESKKLITKTLTEKDWELIKEALITTMVQYASDGNNAKDDRFKKLIKKSDEMERLLNQL